MRRSIGNLRSTDRNVHRQVLSDYSDYSFFVVPLYPCTLLGYMLLWICLRNWICCRIFAPEIIFIVMDEEKSKMNRNQMAYDAQLAPEDNASDRGERVGSDTLF